MCLTRMRSLRRIAGRDVLSASWHCRSSCCESPSRIRRAKAVAGEAGRASGRTHEVHSSSGGFLSPGRQPGPNRCVSRPSALGRATISGEGLKGFPTKAETSNSMVIHSVEVPTRGTMSWPELSCLKASRTAAGTSSRPLNGRRRCPPLLTGRALDGKTATRPSISR